MPLAAIEPHPRATRRLSLVRTAARALAAGAAGAVLLAVIAGMTAMALQIPSDAPDDLWTHVISTTAAVATPVFILAIAALIAVRITTSIYRSNDTSTPKES